ncbi:NAD(P)/FAD-dependent oxidoreductase [Crocosphaera sp. UHCC 0190]|uniref:FAD-dependent oxidoreductase n=1 Tax=Crocosphaera sp. UHCC 0190 TaxID=3110246 RepID=UPI002B20EAB6|nr:NAD(P)/FAD-dependent oxidoreductase [Crocosphaera sp. UHCC 0190]MEA5512040.1 NAD(P)/FAD-dependent oxidoreductase [Crocosphaera sp. UHCC 0190]
MNTPITIIGAGPAGLLLAHYLLRRGHYQIEIYESRPDPRLSTHDDQRTFPLAIQARGRKALSKIDNLEEKICQKGTFCQGTLVHQKKGKSRLIPRSNSILTIDRSVLSLVLLENLVKADNQTRLKIHFDHRCTQIKSQEKTLFFQTNNHEEIKVNYNILIGADGANSLVRDCFLENSSFNCQKNYVSDVYKSIYLPLNLPEKSLFLDKDKFHSIRLTENMRMLLVPQGENNLNGVVIFKQESNPFKNSKKPSDILKFLQENAGIIGQLIDIEEVESLMKRPISQVVTIQCNQFHQGDSILILGDAAHAVSPSLGQGCNSALEDAMIIDQLLDKYQDNWGKVMAEFTIQRVPDADALQELSNFTFPSKKSLLFEYFLRLRLSRLLRQWFPDKFSPPIFELVAETNLSYADILQRHQGWIKKVKQFQ